METNAASTDTVAADAADDAAVAVEKKSGSPPAESDAPMVPLL
jgi:hypothetical protein